MTDAEKTIMIPISAARRMADLLDYLSYMAADAHDHIEDAEDRRELSQERAAGLHWATYLRRDAPFPPITSTQRGPQ
ncbi:MAG: hypothetical protein NTZ29_15800 [Verrucomicrobia bacterium]|nr:hypothetical protein [Verrucomicrobiota bacterium]